jgi:hypothetical protein
LEEITAAEGATEPPEPDEPRRPIDRQLFAEARLYGVAYSPYLEMSPRERGALKARWTHKIRAEAKRRNVDPDEFVQMDEDQRERAREEYPERLPVVARKTLPSAAKRPEPRTIDDVVRSHAPESPIGVADMVDEGLTRPDVESFSQGADDAPPTEADPKRRDRATLGEVRPVDNVDLVGWTQPKNLRDIYSRWTIGDGQHFIRVERIDPRVWQQIPTAGYIGEIREPISEEQFHAFYGGRVYKLQVYGPDPKGRMDATTGLPIIKPKTEPFPYNVPMLPPNLLALPGTSPGKQGERVMQSPFSAFFPGAQPTGIPATPADAQMHKTTVDFFSTLLKRSEDEREDLRRAATSGPSEGVLKVVSESSKSAIEQANRAAEARERTLLESLSQAREDNKALSAKIEKLAEQQNENRGSPVQDAVTLMQTVHPTKSAEEEALRLRASHTAAMTALKTGHEEEIKRERTRHDDELKRLKERLDDAEKAYKAKLDDIDRANKVRERELRDETERVRTDERAVAERRVQETIARFDDRIKDLREQHGRELRMQTEQHSTRVETTKGNLELQLSNQKERIAQLKDDLDQARADLSSATDPSEVIKKAEQQAKVLGYTKRDENGPQTAGERFASTVGMGLSKAFETMNDWVPKAITASRAGAPALGGPAVQPGQQRALGQPQQPGQPGMQQPRPGPSRRAVSWASAGSVPVAGQQYTIPPETPQPAPAPQPAAQQPPPPAQQQAAPSQDPAPQQPSAPSPPSNGNGAATTRLGRVFPDEIVVQFRTEVERAINTGFSAEAFAQRFVGTFPEPARMLVSLHKPEDLIEVVRGMPDGADSPILRRDGTRWVEELWQQIVVQASAQVSAQPQAQA